MLSLKYPRPIRWQNIKLKERYKDELERTNSAIVLANILVGSILIIGVFTFLNVTTDLLDAKSKSFFIPFELSILVILAVAYVFLLLGHYQAVKIGFTILNFCTVSTAIVMTGGFPVSVATPCIILLPVLVYFLHGNRIGFYFALLIPLLLSFQWLLTANNFLELPDYTSDHMPTLNLVMVALVTYAIIVFVVSSYEHNTRTLFEQLRAERSLLADAAFRDSLTGLTNTRGFYSIADKKLQEAGERGAIQTVLFVDLDDFKPINDAFGHEVGDRVLAIVSRRLVHSLREEHVVARVGGDEFAILMSHEEDQANVSEIVGRLRSTITQPIRYADNIHRVGVSIGAAQFPRNGATLQHLMRTADAAMYVDKIGKSNR